MLEAAALAELLEHKRRTRRRAIAALHRRGVREGGPDDPGFWTLVHDLEQAPLTTNLAQLDEIGIELPDPRVLSAAEITTHLTRLVRGLAVLGVYLLRTDHLDDATLYATLHGRVLREPVRDIPPGCGSREWIDLGGGSDRETWLAWYADEDERREAGAAGEVVPNRRPPASDRDAGLPRPSLTASPPRP